MKWAVLVSPKHLNLKYMPAETATLAVFPNIVTFQHEVLRVISTPNAGSLCPYHVTMAIR